MSAPAGDRNVLVIGGGLAGLSAALACADAGLPVTLLEARRALGGATRSFERAGLRIDTGQHVFLRCCTEYRSFLARLGTESRVELQPRLDVPVLEPRGGRAPRVARLRRSRLPAPIHLAGALARYRHLSPADRILAAGAALALARDRAADARDGVAFGTWLRDHRQSEAAIEALWDLIGRATLNLDARAASLSLAAMVFRTGLLTDAGAADLGRALVPLSDLHVTPAEAQLARLGTRIVRGVRVRAIERPAAGRVRVRTDGGAFEGAAAIVAVDHETAAALVPPVAAPGIARAAELGTSPIVNVHVRYDRPVTRLPVVAAVRSPVQWVFDRTEPAGLDRGQYLAVSISAADREIDEPTPVLRERYVAALRDLFPAARRARVLDCFVTRERRATFRGTPGTRALRPPAATRWPELFLAGAWTDTGWPATMEGAVRSGRVAAGLAIRRVSAPSLEPTEACA